MATRNTMSPKTIIILAIVVIAIVGGALFLSNNATNGKTTNTNSISATNANAQTKKEDGPKVNINKTYAAKAIALNGKEAKDRVTMNIKYAEKTQDILIKGTPATAKNGSAFLVFQVELQNTSSERLIVSPLDLLRLVVDNQKRAAEIYSEEVPNIRGSVIIEPDSTKITRIGFVLTPEVINKQYKLQIGEINGTDKTVIDVKI